MKRKNETVFVTMSFSDKMKKARKQISEAIQECGFIPVLIDIKEHNNQIVPEIYKEIESCTFVIADLSGQRGGVYYEAGYAVGKDKQVILTCKKDEADMERIFDETHNVDVANTLAILEANEHAIYDPPAVFDSNKAEILLSTEERLREIYEAFPNEGKVVLGYSYLVSWNYVTWLDFPRPIDEELISLFKKWIRKFPENKLELMEYYSFILFEKWLYMDSLDNISEANKIYYEIKAIADELSKDYADNQVTQMLSMGIVRKL